MVIEPINPLAFIPPVELQIAPQIRNADAAAPVNLTASATPALEQPEAANNNTRAPRIGTRETEDESTENAETGLIGTPQEGRDPVQALLNPGFSRLLLVSEEDNVAQPTAAQTPEVPSGSDTAPEAEQAEEAINRSRISPRLEFEQSGGNDDNDSPESANVVFDRVNSENSESFGVNTEFSESFTDTENSQADEGFQSATPNITLGEEGEVITAATPEENELLREDSDSELARENNEAVSIERAQERLREEKEQLLEQTIPNSNDNDLINPESALQARRSEPETEAFSTAPAAGRTGTISNPEDLGNSTFTEGASQFETAGPEQQRAINENNFNNDTAGNNTRLINPAPVSNPDDLFGINEDDSQESVQFRPLGSESIGEPQRESGEDFFDTDIRSTSVRTLINPTAEDLAQPEEDGIAPQEDPKDSDSSAARQAAFTFNEVLNIQDFTVKTSGHQSGVFFFA